MEKRAAAGDGGLLGSGDPGALRINELRLRNVPLAVALKYIGEATKLRYKVDDFAVTLVPQTETGVDLFTRTFRVPPGFAASLGADGGGVGRRPAIAWSSATRPRLTDRAMGAWAAA